MSEVQNTRLQCACWLRDTAGHLDSRTQDGKNGGYNMHAATFVRVRVVQMITRPNLDLFQHDKLLPPGVNIAYRLMPTADHFVIKAPDNDNTPYRLVIETVELIMRTKQLSEAAEVAHRTLVQKNNMGLPYTRVLLKHLSVAQGLASIAFDKVFTGNVLPELVVLGMITDDDFAGGYHAASSFNYVNRVEMKKHGTPVPRGGYPPSWEDGNYLKGYIKFRSQLGFDTGDKCVQLTRHQSAHGYTLFAFKLTEGPIGSGVAGPRSHSKARTFDSS